MKIKIEGRPVNEVIKDLVAYCNAHEEQSDRTKITIATMQIEIDRLRARINFLDEEPEYTNPGPPWITKAEWTNFLDKAKRNFESQERDGIRKGQAAFNTLAVLHPDIAESIRGTGFDPFYDDKRLHDFLEYVQMNFVRVV